MTPLLAVLFLLLLSSPLSSLCSQGGSQYKDVVYESAACNACAEKGNCSTPTPYYGTRLSYCGTGVLRLPAQSNLTVASSMCCQYTLKAVNDITPNPWQCQPYTGPLDAAWGQVLTGYQCFNPTVAAEGGSAFAALGVGLFICVLLVGLCSLSIMGACFSCFLCGRCRLYPGWMPGWAQAWSPSWMLAVPVAISQPAVSGYPLMYQRM